MDKEEIFDLFKKQFKYGHPEFYNLIIRMCEIHEIKNKGYGLGDPLGNFRLCEKIGIPAWKGCFVRMGDKWARLTNLIRKQGEEEYQDAIKMESIEDTLIDLANYCLLCLILLREEKNGYGRSQSS